MLILGGGIIGLEMGTVWQKMNSKRFDNIMLKTKTVGAKATVAFPKP